ncbi:TIGR02556 family CRISPR-associated protein [Desulfurobacterium sp.]|uniref:TIGR02556 family CRISPR-associated protein n=1 Tax=Desulfurobacterium sp. TaxID=2004706 RepID=UPI00261C1FA4|nr:TIGR02556 family CRISPR-associated protein [Desulfurobacterium sp.]
MIEAIYNLGKILMQDDGNSGKVTPEPVSADRLIIINLDKDGKLINVTDTKNVSEYEKKLLYKRVRASRRCNSCTPTFFLNIKEPQKSITCLKSIFNWMKNYNSSVKEPEDYEAILKALKSYLKDFPPQSREKILLTVTVDGNFPSEIPEIVSAFETGYVQELGFNEIGTCSLCGSTTRITGKKSPFAFYTLNKVGYISGFSIKNHGKGFPICFECFKKLEKAKQYISSKNFILTKNAPRYWLVPGVIFDTEISGSNSLKELIENIYDLEYMKKYLHLTETEHQKLADTEEDILDILKELEDYLTFHFIFIEKNQSQEIIKLHIQDIYPSRIKKLFEAKTHVEKNLELKREFTFGTLGQFFWKWDKHSKRKDLQKYFLDLIDRIFREVPFSEALLIKFLLNGIRRAYLDEEYDKLTALNALASFLFVKATTEGIMETIKTDDVRNLLETLPLLNTPEAKGLFVLGVLTQRLIDKQAGTRKGNKPFLKKLSSFKLDQRGFEKLMPELRDKMEAYEIFGKFERELFDLASECFAKANQPWKLNVEKMNFVFAVGMGMKDKIYNKKFENKTDGGKS